MAEKLITLKVLTKEGLILKESVSSIIAPGGLGYLGVLYNHAPMVSTVREGRLSWKRSDKTEGVAQLGAGILEVSHNTVTLLVDSYSADSGDRNPIHG